MPELPDINQTIKLTIETALGKSADASTKQLAKMNKLLARQEKTFSKISKSSLKAYEKMMKGANKSQERINKTFTKTISSLSRQNLKLKQNTQSMRRMRQESQGLSLSLGKIAAIFATFKIGQLLGDLGATRLQSRRFQSPTTRAFFAAQKNSQKLQETANAFAAQSPANQFLLNSRTALEGFAKINQKLLATGVGEETSRGVFLEATKSFVDPKRQEAFLNALGTGKISDVLNKFDSRNQAAAFDQLRNIFASTGTEVGKTAVDKAAEELNKSKNALKTAFIDLAESITGTLQPAINALSGLVQRHPTSSIVGGTIVGTGATILGGRFALGKAKSFLAARGAQAAASTAQALPSVAGFGAHPSVQAAGLKSVVKSAGKSFAFRAGAQVGRLGSRLIPGVGAGLTAMDIYAIGGETLRLRSDREQARQRVAEEGVRFRSNLSRAGQDQLSADPMTRLRGRLLELTTKASNTSSEEVLQAMRKQRAEIFKQIAAIEKSTESHKKNSEAATKNAESTTKQTATTQTNKFAQLISTLPGLTIKADQQQLVANIARLQQQREQIGLFGALGSQKAVQNTLEKIRQQIVTQSEILKINQIDSSDQGKIQSLRTQEKIEQLRLQEKQTAITFISEMRNQLLGEAFTAGSGKFEKIILSSRLNAGIGQQIGALNLKGPQGFSPGHFIGSIGAAAAATNNPPYRIPSLLTGPGIIDLTRPGAIEKARRSPEKQAAIDASKKRFKRLGKSFSTGKSSKAANKAADHLAAAAEIYQEIGSRVDLIEATQPLNTEPSRPTTSGQGRAL